MKIRFPVHAVSLIAVIICCAITAGASPITFNTSATGAGGTGFNSSGSLNLTSSGGAAANLNFVPDANFAAAVPGNVNFGNFTLTCAGCSTQANGIGASFGAFTFDMVITDVSDNATGTFFGSASAGTIYLDASTITLKWLPLQLGPGPTNATSGNFGSTYFTTTVTTRIVNPTSGAAPGSTTVQGDIASVPEPATLTLVGGALLGLGLFRRKSGPRP